MAHTILASVPITTFPLPPSRPPVSVSGAVQSSMFLIIKQVRLAKQPNRCLHHIKRNHPRETYHAVLERFFHGFWTPPHLNLTQVDILAAVLADTGRFSPEECEAIPAAAKEQEVKDMLTRSTQEALDRGAFGAPWLWVTNEEGREEPIFGSDRYVVSGMPPGILDADAGAGFTTCTSSSDCRIETSSCCLPEESPSSDDEGLGGRGVRELTETYVRCIRRLGGISSQYQTCSSLVNALFPFREPVQRPSKT